MRPSQTALLLCVGESPKKMSKVKLVEKKKKERKTQEIFTGEQFTNFPRQVSEIRFLLLALFFLFVGFSEQLSRDLSGS